MVISTCLQGVKSTVSCYDHKWHFYHSLPTHQNGPAASGIESLVSNGIYSPVISFIVGDVTTKLIGQIRISWQSDLQLSTEHTTQTTLPVAHTHSKFAEIMHQLQHFGLASWLKRAPLKGYMWNSQWVNWEALLVNVLLSESEFFQLVPPSILSYFL